MAFSLPKQGFAFWPVGTGDSSTIVVKENEVIVQIDLHHLVKSDDKDTAHVPIVDELVRLLPKKNNRPYLSVFILTHPDEDHVLGFADLLKRVDIGEIWHTPRIFREHKGDLCYDAQKFCDEVGRRRDLTIQKGGAVGAGDRVRVIGHDDGVFKDDEDYKNFPEEWRAFPGTSLTMLDGTDYVEVFEAFIHAPFKDDAADTRNNTSLALHIALYNGARSLKGLFFGDREYPTVKEIFTKTKDKERTQYLEWDVLLAPHHCSKKVMFWADSEGGNETFKQDVMDEFEEAAQPGSYIVASAESDFGDGAGRCPPHLSARKKYEAIVDADHFLCTHEQPTVTAPEPFKFELSDSGISYAGPGKAKSTAAAFASALSGGRAGDEPPKTWVGHGK